MLGLEITLTRVFALAHWYHFAFMAISVALLGLGAGGTALALWPSLARHPRRLATFSAVGFTFTTLASYLAANWLPFDAYRIALERVQFAYLVAYYLVLCLPFFFASLGIGVLLSAFPTHSHRIYACNLLGSAAGGGLAPLALLAAGGAGAVGLWVALGGLASVALAMAAGPRTRLAGAGAGLALACGGLFVAWLQPVWFEVRLSSHKGLPQALQLPGAHVVWQGWDARVRVDVVESPAFHAAPGMSLSCAAPLPGQLAIFLDGDNPSARLAESPTEVRDWVECLPLALIYKLRPQATALILEPKGNLDVIAAHALGAQAVTVAEANQLLVAAAGWHPRSQVVVEPARSFLRRTEHRYAIIDMALHGSRNVVTTGAYSLSEEYQYTTEAFRDALGRLEEGGLLAVSRWLQTPPSESLRAWALAVTAVEDLGVPDVPDRLAAIRSWSTMLILVKNGPFTSGEIDQIRAFCREHQFDLVYLPDITPGEVNRYNIYPGAPYATAFQQLLRSEDRRSFYETREFDVRPPSDDKPFFFHFFTWKQLPRILRELGHTWRPFGGGGYLVLLFVLVVATLFAGALSILPWLAGAGRQEVSKGWVLAYFALIGLGFLAVEVPLLQQLTLFLGHPTVAFATVVAGLLLFSGVGSLLSRRVRWGWALAGLVMAIPLTVLGLRVIVPEFLGASLLVRVAATCIALGPLGTLLGMPFAKGLTHLAETSPGLTPWAWAVNGSASVVAAVGVALGALAGGFVAVLGFAVVTYAGATLVVIRWKRISDRQ
jgi:hypothetical protein